MNSRFKALMDAPEPAYNSVMSLELGDEEKDKAYKEAALKARNHSLFSSLSGSCEDSEEGTSHSLDDILMKMESTLNEAGQEQKEGAAVAKSEFVLDLKTLESKGSLVADGVKIEEDGTIVRGSEESEHTNKFKVEGASTEMQKKFDLNGHKEKTDTRPAAKSKSAPKAKVTVGAALGKTTTAKKSTALKSSGSETKIKTGGKLGAKSTTPKISVSPVTKTTKTATTVKKVGNVKATPAPVKEPVVVTPTPETKTAVEPKVTVEPMQEVVAEKAAPMDVAQKPVEQASEDTLISNVQQIDSIGSKDLSTTFQRVSLEVLAKVCESTVLDVAKWAYKAVKTAFSRGKIPTKSEGIKSLMYCTHFIEGDGSVVVSLAAGDYLSVVQFPNGGKEHKDVTATAVVKGNVVTYDEHPIAFASYKMQATRTL